MIDLIQKQNFSSSNVQAYSVRTPQKPCYADPRSIRILDNRWKWNLSHRKMGERILKVKLSTRAQPLCVLPTSEQIVNTNTNSFTSVSVSGTLKTPPLLILVLCSHLLASRASCYRWLRLT